MGLRLLRIILFILIGFGVYINFYGRNSKHLLGSVTSKSEDGVIFYIGAINKNIDTVPGIISKRKVSFDSTSIIGSGRSDSLNKLLEEYMQSRSSAPRPYKYRVF